MSNFVIVTDSSCDLSEKIINQFGLTVVQLEVLVDGDESKPNDKVDFKNFYSQLRDGKMAKTSASNIASFRDIFVPILEKGNDILYLGFSSGLSTTYNSGYMAAAELLSEFPERRIYTVDTLSASLGQGLLVYLSAMKKEAGATIEEVRDFAEQTKLHLCHWFTVDDLHFLKRGGRVSATVAIVGSVLGIKPVLHMDNEGHLINVGKARGRKASIDELVSKMKQTAIDLKDQTVFISHGDCADEAEAVAKTIKKELGVKDVVVGYVGPVIGAHSGPGTLAIFFVGTER